jgi:hypothetical protein
MSICHASKAAQCLRRSIFTPNDSDKRLGDIDIVKRFFALKDLV